MNIKIKFQEWFVAICLVAFSMVTPSWAGSIEGLSLLDSDDGDVLIVESSEPLEYQVFDLTDPARLIMTFPGADISPAIVAIKGDGAGIKTLFPKANELGVRLEMSLSETLGYEVEEQGNTLVVRFDSPDIDGSNEPTTPVLKKISIKDKSNITEILIDGLNLSASHNAFLTNSNSTLVVDIWGAKSELKKDVFQYASQFVKSVVVGEADDRLRLIVDLNPANKMSHQIDVSDEQMVISFGEFTKKRSDILTIENVSFQPDGVYAKVMIRTNETNPIIEVHDEKGSMVVDFTNASLAQGQELTQDLSAFAGPVSQIDTYQKGDNVRVVIRTREKVDVSSFQQGNVFSLNFTPIYLTEAARGKKSSDGEFSYIGEKVTFDFKDIDIRNALKLIAEMSDLNIIMSGDVTGTLTMRLVDVPWDQALELILSAKGLGKEQNGNVLRVAPVDVLREEYKSKIEARKGSLQLEKLITEFITLSYTRAEDVKSILNDAASSSQKSTGAAEGAMPTSDNSGLLTSRGTVLIDARTNTLIIKDTRTAINNVKNLIAAIDKPIEQVLIEARIVEASDNFTSGIGVRWGGSINRETTSNFPGSVAIGAAGTTQQNSNDIITGGQAAATGRGFLVDLPSTGTAGSIGLSLGSFSNAINLDLELSAAQADGDAKIISNPRIVTSNLKQATVTQGTLVPIVTPGSANSPATTTLTKAALTLDVTPQITADGGVILDIAVSKDSPTVFNGATGIESKAVTTTVYVKDGETIVIGGVYTRDKSFNTTSIPYLSEVPFLGWLFKSETTKDTKTELLMFITPKIIQGFAGGE